MNRRIEKGVQAEHATEAHEPAPAGEFAQRCDGERDEQELERPAAQVANHELDRIGAQCIVIQTPAELRERNQADEENDNLECGDLPR